MGLEIKVLQTLDFLASKANNKLDETALDYINKLAIPHNQPYLKTEYKNYYFQSKKEAREQYRKEVL